MGPPERGLEFAELTEFPPELLLADPENVTYDKLELKNTGPIATFFDPRVRSACWHVGMKVAVYF